MVSQDLLEFAAKRYGFDAGSLEHIPRSSGKVQNKVCAFFKDDKKGVSRKQG